MNWLTKYSAWGRLSQNLAVGLINTASVVVAWEEQKRSFTIEMIKIFAASLLKI